MTYAHNILAGNTEKSNFLVNIRSVAIAGIVQLIGFAYIIVISDAKPWKNGSKTCIQIFLCFHY